MLFHGTRTKKPNRVRASQPLLSAAVPAPQCKFSTAQRSLVQHQAALQSAAPLPELTERLSVRRVGLLLTSLSKNWIVPASYLSVPVSTFKTRQTCLLYPKKAPLTPPRAAHRPHAASPVGRAPRRPGALVRMPLGRRVGWAQRGPQSTKALE